MIIRINFLGNIFKELPFLFIQKYNCKLRLHTNLKFEKMDNRTWNSFFPPNGDPTNRRFQTRPTPPPASKPSRPTPQSRRSQYGQYGPSASAYSTVADDAERIAWIKARSDETRRKFEEMRIRNYVDHYFNMAMLNAKMSKIIAEDELESEIHERNKKRSKSPTAQPKRKKYVFYRSVEDGLRFTRLKTGPKNVEFRIAVDVKSCHPRNIHIDSKDNIITVKATTLGGRVKTLSIVCPSAEDVDGIKINIPKNGILLIEGPESTEIDIEN